MSDRLMQILALLVVSGFLGIVLLHVPRLDLAAVIAVTLLAVGYDFFFTSGSRSRRK